MFDRFTDRARRVLSLARREAERLGQDHIGTEHILLGLARIGGGVADRALRKLDVDLQTIRTKVQELISFGPPAVTSELIPFTPRARHALEFAQDEANHLGHDYIGTEHLLLGLLRESGGVAAQVLMNLGLNIEDFREKILELLRPPEPGAQPDAPPG